MTMLGNTPHGSLASPFGASARRSAEYLRDYVQEKAIPGLSATVAANGRIVWSEGFGWADLENRSPVTPLTRFRIGSVSKPFAALLLATLATQGQVCLDAEIQAYLPTFPVKRWPVTLRQLASHLGGIRSYEGTEYLDNAFGSIQAGLEVFRNDPLVHQPGTEFHYSSYGYNLLGALIENVCGADFAACLERHVIEPLGLRNTIPDYPDRLIPFRARPYELSPDGAWRNATVHDLLYKLPAGGLLSTTGDLVRFGLAHLGGGAISSEVLSLLLSHQRTVDGRDTGHGFSWSLASDDELGVVWYHTGDSAGGCSELAIYPQAGLVVALAGNRRGHWSEELVRVVAGRFCAALDA